jgi:phosphotransacetylase
MKTIRKAIENKWTTITLEKEEEQKLIARTIKKNANRLAKVTSFVNEKDKDIKEVIDGIELDKAKVIELIFLQIAEPLEDVVSDYVEEQIENGKIKPSKKDIE